MLLPGEVSKQPLMHIGLRHAVVDPPCSGADPGTDFLQPGSYGSDLPDLGKLYRCRPDSLFEQHEQLIGQAADQQTQEVGLVAVVGQPVGKRLRKEYMI